MDSNDIVFSMPKLSTSGDFVMPFGKYKGKTLDRIASDDEGLRYLDWAAGEFEAGDVLDAIEAYVADPLVAREIENALANQDVQKESRGWHGDKGWWSK